MDFKLKNMTYYKDFGSMTFGIVPYAIYDIKDKILYLPDLDWLSKIKNTDYQKWIDDFLGDNYEGRYNVMIMGNLYWKKVLAMNKGIYTLNPIKFNKGINDIESYAGYFIKE